MTTFPLLERTIGPKLLRRLATAFLNGLSELRRAHMASRRHEELRERLARRESYLDISRHVVREVYGDRLPPDAFWSTRQK